MERLTKRLGNGLVRPFINGKPVPIHYMSMEEIQARLDRLAAYEDAEETERLLRLPCAVGDTMYYLGYKDDEEQLSVRTFVVDSLRTIIMYMELGAIGDCIFPTREEAEAALAKKGRG